MQGRGTEQDYDEFEMLLGEIPNATSHPRESSPVVSSSDVEAISLEKEDRKSSPSHSFTNLYRVSQPANHSSKATFYAGVAFERPESVNASKGPQKILSDESLDAGKITMKSDYQTSVIDVNRDASNLHDAQSLTSAFDELSLKEAIVMEPTTPGLFEYKNLPNSTILLEGQYSDHFENSFTPSSANTVNGMNLVNPASVPNSSLTSTNELDKFNGEINGQESTNYLKLNVHELMKPEHFPGDLVGQRLGLPLYSGAMQLAPDLHNFQMLSNVPIYPYLQQLQTQGSEFHPIQAIANPAIGSMTRNTQQPYFEMPISHQTELANKDFYWNDNSVPSGFNQPNLTVMGNSLCPYYAQGFSGRGDTCPFAHGQRQMSASSLAWPQTLDKEVRPNFPEKILTRTHGLNSLNAIKPGSIGGYESLNHVDFRLSSKSQQQKFNSVDEVKGRIYLMTKDQLGCRFLQRKFDEGISEDIHKIFVEIIGHIVELMTDPFGNYLVQKLLEICNEVQRTHILHVVTRSGGQLGRISCDMHGTRSVQKLIETLTTPEQLSMVVSSLDPDIVTLIKDTNGNHVAQCLLNLGPEYNEFLLDAATAHCVELATDRHGCCVIQKCIHKSDGDRKHHLMSEIASNALVLSQNLYGNYVVQCVIELRVPWVMASVLDQLRGNYGYLSVQKYSSNVVENCLKTANEDQRAQIIQELMNNSRFGQILQDPYGNYVVQCALTQSKGTLHNALVEAIRPSVPILRSSPYGKKILSNKSLKK
ncbi:pumilio homolog 12-like [Tasmannia lanceolata]|uniref:pumilio homolog 12-like n=1 Tax=Tasmannia lanceolata TaxID=3420 RepID=UPI004064889F